MNIYENLLRPFMFNLDPEAAHEFAMFWLEHLPPAVVGSFRSEFKPEPRTVFGVTFPNILGLAAGFDKNAVALRAWEALGFGFIEAGTITAKAQPGNPQPRLFRIKAQEAIINRMGFNNDGADALALRLRAQKAANRWPEIPVGINIGKSKVTPLEEATQDYLYSLERLYPYGDYFVLNVSSPNTPGLRKLQERGALEELLREVQRKSRELAGAGKTPKPVLVKIAPDLEWSQIDEVIELAETHALAGMVATNTTIDHSSVPEKLRQQGGLSGPPVRQRSTEIIKHITGRTKLPVIGVGGIDSPEAAQEKLDAGAALLQMYTGFIYRGPQVIERILRGVNWATT